MIAMPTTRFSSGTFKKSGDVQLVDLSEKAASAKIVREGLNVPPVKLDDDALDRFVLEDLIKPEEAPRVVSQSVKAGTKVPRGTEVDLFLAPRQSIPGKLIPGSHRGIAKETTTMEDIVKAHLADRAMRERVAKYESFEEMPERDRTAFRQALEEQDIQIDETKSDLNSDAAFRTMKTALAFG
jgi:hypothetical protein